MPVAFTVTQLERLTELNASAEEMALSFADAAERNARFKELETAYTRRWRGQLKTLLAEKHAPDTWHIEQALSRWLMEAEGFTRVSTPTIITSKMLDKMTITEEHHLHEQVFWLDRSRCLRPMLAPNLYVLMKELKKITGGPVKIFEAGSCFRKESQGAQHMNEFTMLNFVEFASVPDGGQMERLEFMARSAMKVVGIEDYELVKEQSTVYEETLDIVVNGVEIASGSYGPHPLDAKWGVFDTWVGLGLGIERIAYVKGGYQTIKRVGRSTTFLDGAPLSL